MPTSRMPDDARTSHLHRGAAEGFGADAERYDRARPVTPRPVADAVLRYLTDGGRPGGDAGPGEAVTSLGPAPGRSVEGARPAASPASGLGGLAADQAAADRAAADRAAAGRAAAGRAAAGRAAADRLAPRSAGGAPRVLDVGIGTGLSAVPFRAAGAAVLGVEADPRMAAVARARGFEVEVARFEEWDPAGRRFDAVVSGMTWHWVDPVAGAVQAARVLRDGGVLAVFWHAADLPPTLRAALHDLYSRELAGTPGAGMYAPGRTAADGYEAMLDRAADGLAEAGGFAEPDRRRHAWQRRYTVAEWLDQVPTSGGFARLPEPVRRAVLDGTRSALESVGDGTFTVDHTTVLLTARRTG